MKKIEILCKNNWVSLLKMIYPEKGCNGYIYSHETRCDGHIVSILPYRINDNKLEIMLRKEVTPCWDINNQVISSITGGWEKDKHLTPLFTAVEEIHEEAGYIVNASDIIELGTIFGIKSSDTIYHLYTVDLTNKEQGEAIGDGSELEAQASCYWTTSIKDAKDPFVFTMFYKLMKLLNVEFKYKG